MDPHTLELQQRLLLLENSRPISTISELCAVRCPLCGDSLNLRSAHMYIGYKVIDGKDVIFYDCKKCGQGNILTPSILHKLGIVDVGLDEFLKSSNKLKAMKTFTNDTDMSSIKYKYPKITSADKAKIDYLSNRLQIDFSQQENIEKYKIVLNFGKFLQINNLKEPQCAPDKIPLFSEGIGFVSEDKCSISIRNMNEYTTGARFNIIHLYPKIRKPFCYIPPCNIDILTPYPKICIAESSFNIINIRNYFYGEDTTNIIYASSSRKACYHTIKRLMSLTGFVGGKLEIYADNDSPNNYNDSEFFNKMLDYFDNLLDPLKSTFDISIIVSTTSKDMGEMPKNGERFEYRTFHI